MLRHQNHRPTAFKTLPASRLKLPASLLILLAAVLPSSTQAKDIRSYSEVSQFTERRTVTEHRTITERASWYGPGLNGRKTANGEIFSSRKMTAAAKGIPLGSRAVVTNLKNGRSVEVKINDCVPTRRRQNLDLSKRAAQRLGLIRRGTTPVKVRVVEVPPGVPKCPS